MTNLTQLEAIVLAQLVAREIAPAAPRPALDWINAPRLLAKLTEMYRLEGVRC